MKTRSEKNKKVHLERDKEEYLKKRRKRIKRIVITSLILILFSTIIYLYARYLEPSMLIVKEEMLYNENLPDSFDGLKVIHFSDIHYGSTIDIDYMKRLVEEINVRDPDLVLFTGDFIDKGTTLSLEEETELISILGSIEANIGKYAVKGNHDYQDDKFELIMLDGGFKTLNNSYQLIYFEGYDPILLTGLSSSIKTTIDVDSAFNYFTLENHNPNIYTISLFHEPDSIDAILEKYKTDLALAGHSHGGQIRLPFIGGLGKIKGAEVYYDDYYRVNDTDLFISYGIGTSMYDFRFMNPPSFNFYRLTK